MPRNGCITSVRYAMVCDILSPSGAPADTTGQWVYTQNPESGAIEQKWVDDAGTVEVEGVTRKDILLFAEGVLDGGIRVAGTTERFTREYENVDFVKAVFPSDTIISKRDKVINIRSRKNGEVLWREEEIDGWPPTTFNVLGVTPVLFLGNIIEKSVLLERSEVQHGG